MNVDVLIPMAFFALATSATPGPVNIISAMTGARYGSLRTLPYVLGATVSFVSLLVLIGLGMTSILGLVQKFASVLLLLGSAYMLFLAYKISRINGEIDLQDGEQKSCPGFLAGFMMQSSNPKAWFVSLSAITIYITPQAQYGLYLTMFAILFFIICALSLAMWSFIGQHIAKISGNFILLNKMMAGLLVLSVVMMIYEHFSELVP